VSFQREQREIGSKLRHIGVDSSLGDRCTYCLDPRTGEQRWYNELSGFGTGVSSIATLGKNNLHDLLLAAAAADAAAAAAASAANTTVVTSG
jgi:hypothetical protein